jgi:hypothetical protein
VTPASREEEALQAQPIDDLPGPGQQCPTCGHRLRQAGHHLDTVRVLRSGVLTARQTPGQDGMWTVTHTPTGREVATIRPATTPRGRHYYTGHLRAWPEHDYVQAPTPRTVLRKLTASGAGITSPAERS